MELGKLSTEEFNTFSKGSKIKKIILIVSIAVIVLAIIGLIIFLVMRKKKEHFANENKEENNEIKQYEEINEEDENRKPHKNVLDSLEEIQNAEEKGTIQYDSATLDKEYKRYSNDEDKAPSVQEIINAQTEPKRKRRHHRKPTDKHIITTYDNETGETSSKQYTEYEAKQILNNIKENE